MPIITISWFPGRTTEQKNELAKAITQAMVEIGKTTPDAVTIMFNEQGQDNWAFGGVLASKRDKK